MILNKIKINDTATVSPGVVYDISKATGQSYETLSDALSGNNVPPEVREGGMTVRYVYTSDNKYVQYRLMHTLSNASTASVDFANTANWQGVDNSLVPESNNLIEGGAVTLKFGNILNALKSFVRAINKISEIPPIVAGRRYRIIMSYDNEINRENIYLNTYRGSNVTVESTGIELNVTQVIKTLSVDTYWTATQDAEYWGVYSNGNTDVNVAIVEADSIYDELLDKQDKIDDLEEIREGAAAGATAVQDSNYVHTDNNFTNEDKENVDTVDIIEDELNGKEGIIINDFSSYDVLNLQVSNKGEWQAGSSILVPITGGRKFIVTNSGTSTDPQMAAGGLWFTVLTDDKFIINGYNAHISEDFIEKYGNRIQVNKSESSSIIECPSDGKFISIVAPARLGKIEIEKIVGIKEEIVDIKGEVFIAKDAERIINFSSFHKENGIVVNGKWTAVAGGETTFIPVEGKKYATIQNSQVRSIYYSLLANDNYEVGANAPYIGADRDFLDTSKRITIEIPIECKFLCVTTKLNNVVCTPAYIEFPEVRDQSELQKEKGVYAGLYGEQFNVAGCSMVGGISQWKDFGFVHITDMHGSFTAAGVANAVRDRFNYFIPILNTGDIVKYEPKINGVINPDITNYMQLATAYRIFHIVGQHEVGFTNLSAGAQFDGKLKSNCMTHDEVLNILIKPMAEIWGIPTPTTPYWYKDFSKEKIRLIGLYQYNCPLTTDPNDSSKYLYDRGKCWYGQEQLDWFVGLLNSAPTGYSIVVMMHEADGVITYTENNYKYPGASITGGYGIIDGSPIFDLLDAFVSRGTLTRDYYCKDTTTYPTDIFHMSVNADFTNAVANYGVCLGGDFHRDHLGIFGTNNLLYKGMTASSEQATDCYVDGNVNVSKFYSKDLSCNCIVDACGITKEDNKLCIGRVGQTTSIYMQDRRFIRIDRRI